MYRILICDDDPEILEAISVYLQMEGYQTVKAASGIEAVKLMAEDGHNFQLIVMDLMMPDMDGMQATRLIREDFNLPILMLTARSEEQDKIRGLNIGADDYLTKPFSPMELRARVRSLLRRYTKLGSLTEQAATYSYSGLVLDDESKSVTVDGDPVNLTASEYNIVLFLLKNKGKIFSSSQIYEEVWGEQALGSENVVAVHIRHIREKIEINPREPRYIKVLWGQGYKIG